MNADLMRTTGLQTAFHDRVTIQVFDRFDVRDRMLTDILQGSAAPLAVASVADQIGGDRLCFQFALHNGHILAMHIVLAEHLHEFLFGFGSWR